MNLARVLFKKHHHHQQRASSLEDQRHPDDHVSSDNCSAEGGLDAGETSPTTRSPRRKTRSSTTAVKSSSSTGELRPLHTTVVFKAIKSSSHRRFAQVLPNLLLGCQEMAHDMRTLRHHGVTHILNVTAEVSDMFPGQYVYKRIAISDMPSAPIVEHFSEAFRFIDEGRASPGGVVLVHCYFGNSRSATVIIGYLMFSERMRYADALEYVRILRPDVRPNDGFQRQLKAYEATVRR